MKGVDLLRIVRSDNKPFRNENTYIDSQKKAKWMKWGGGVGGEEYNCQRVCYLILKEVKPISYLLYYSQTLIRALIYVFDLLQYKI